MVTTITLNKKHPLHELLRKRRSQRSFSSRPVEPEKLASLFEAARWAASSYNEQPWRYLFATREEPEAFDRLQGLLMESNQVWAREAYALVLSVAKRTLSVNGKPNKFYLHDTGAANTTMALQATALGLNLHQIGGYHADKARQVLHLPDDYEPVSMMAIGYPGSLDDLPEDLRQREMAPRGRRPIEELVFEGEWQDFQST
jgi:nitroreductase